MTMLFENSEERNTSLNNEILELSDSSSDCSSSFINRSHSLQAQNQKPAKRLVTNSCGKIAQDKHSRSSSNCKGSNVKKRMNRNVAESSTEESSSDNHKSIKNKNKTICEATDKNKPTCEATDKNKTTCEATDKNKPTCEATDKNKTTCEATDKNKSRIKEKYIVDNSNFEALIEVISGEQIEDNEYRVPTIYPTHQIFPSMPPVNHYRILPPVHHNIPTQPYDSQGYDQYNMRLISYNKFLAWLRSNFEVINNYNDLPDEPFLEDTRGGFHCADPNCRKILPDISRIKRHFLVHTNIKPYKCKNIGCNKAFNRKDNRDTHSKENCAYNPRNRISDESSEKQL
jgi:hypothetical protein